MKGIGESSLLFLPFDSLPRSKGTSSSNSSTTGASAVSMRPKKVSRKGGLKAKKAKRKVLLFTFPRLSSSLRLAPTPCSKTRNLLTRPPMPLSSSNTSPSSLSNRSPLRLSFPHNRHPRQISLDDSPFSQQQSTSGSHCGLPKVK